MIGFGGSWPWLCLGAFLTPASRRWSRENGSLVLWAVSERAGSDHVAVAVRWGNGQLVPGALQEAVVMLSGWGSTSEHSNPRLRLRLSSCRTASAMTRLLLRSNHGGPASLTIVLLLIHALWLLVLINEPKDVVEFKVDLHQTLLHFIGTGCLGIAFCNEAT